MSMYDTVQFRGDEFRTHTFDCVGADYKIDDGMLISHCFVVPYDEENHINNAVDGFRLVDYTGILKLRSRREIVKLHLENGFVIDTIIVGVCVWPRMKSEKEVREQLEHARKRRDEIESLKEEKERLNPNY